MSLPAFQRSVVFHNQGCDQGSEIVALMMEAVQTSETLVNFYTSIQGATIQKTAMFRKFVVELLR
jgi:hypothetical protein